ncbi:MAG: ABC transporter ATP-binding protein [Marmoricola sp.]
MSFDRIFEVLDLPITVADKPDALELPSDASRVEFQDVRFSYPSASESGLASLEGLSRIESADQGEVLKGVTFAAEPGTMVALVGPSGAGKTTTTHLVARLYDVTDGAVKVGTAEKMYDVRDVQQSRSSRWWDM